MPTLAGTQLDKYDMLEEVGHGGMAVVYRGRDRVLEREVAVKVLHPHLADREESRERLRREAIAVAKLRHENILEIFDYSGTDTPESYIVTEFIHGPTLRDWMDVDYQPRPAIAAMIVHRLALALSCAHKGAIVHRDIKPENVMIRRDDGCIKLMDFGIAQILDNQKLTMTGQLIGSPAYMAPELISGRPLDARTDLFSLGILLYQLATGELPFAGRNPHEVLNRIADGNYVPPSTVCALCDLDIEAIIARTLANNPDERFQSAETLASELEAYLAEMDLEPDPAEMCRYFREPAEYVRDLDARVSTALMAQAEKAAREGLHGRAIRLLGRVLELDKEHKAARSLLVRLRVRERRMRQVLVFGATLGLAGLLAAGYMLLPPPARERPHVAVDDPPTDDGLSAHNVVPDEPSIPIAPPPSRVPERVASTGVDEPSRDAGGIEEAETTDGEPRPRPGKPATPSKPPQRTVPEIDCEIEVAGPSASAAKSIKVMVGSKAHRIGLDGKVKFKLEGPDVHISLNSSRYLGGIDVRRDECVAGTLVLVAKPRPTALTFSNAPADLVVICEKGCPDALLRKPLRPSSFEKIVFGDGKDRHELELTLKREGAYKPQSVTQEVLPGTNEVTVDIQPL
ncbi:MAG TPA: serine/threonine-protein kinase [Nannocystaceae bacterium]|nr:serine/threonine-protein kinase [Nannocystaceae bacterium]